MIAPKLTKLPSGTIDRHWFEKARILILEDIRDQGWANIVPEIGGRATNDIVDILEWDGLIEPSAGHWSTSRFLLTDAGREIERDELQTRPNRCAWLCDKCNEAR